MRVILIFIFIIFIQLKACSSVQDYIDEYVKYFDNKSYKLITKGLKNNTPISLDEKYKILDNELQSELGTTFVYVDLQDCIRIALQGNYDIKITDADVLNKYWVNKNAQVQILPDLYYNYNISNLSGKYLIGGILAAREHEVPIQSFFVLRWSTIEQGKYFYYMSQTKNALNSARFNLEYTKDETILNTVLTYYDVLSYKMQIEVQKLNLYERVEQLMYTQARFESGLGTLYDVKRAQAEVAGAQQEYTETVNNFKLVQAKLANIIGVDILESIYPYEVAVDERVLVDKNFSIEKLYNQALHSREDIKAKEAEIKAYKAKRNSNYADMIPNIVLSYQNGHVGTKDSGLSKSNTITLDIEAHLGKNALAGTFTQIKADSAILKKKILELENLKRQVKEDILNSYYDSLNALKKIEASKVEVEAADVSLDLSIVNMKAGEATFIDVIASQNLKLTANINLIKNMIEYNKAQTRLLFDVGVISPKNVLKDYKTRY